MSSIDGAECRHGVNIFDPRGCAQCKDEQAFNKLMHFSGVKNGVVPDSSTFDAAKAANKARRCEFPDCDCDLTDNSGHKCPRQT